MKLNLKFLAILLKVVPNHIILLDSKNIKPHQKDFRGKTKKTDVRGCILSRKGRFIEVIKEA